MYFDPQPAAMKAVVYHEFGGGISLATVDDPSPQPDGAMIRVEATGLCRGDWNGWRVGEGRERGEF